MYSIFYKSYCIRLAKPLFHQRRKYLLAFLCHLILFLPAPSSYSAPTPEQKAKAEALLARSKERREGRLEVKATKAACNFAQLAITNPGNLTKFIQATAKQLEKNLADSISKPNQQANLSLIAEKHFKKIFTEVEKLDQKQLKELLEKNLEMQIAERGYPRGLRPQQMYNTLSDFLLDFVRKSPDNAYANAWGNVYVDATFFSFELTSMKESLPENLSRQIMDVFNVAVWEQCRRLIMRGQWKEFDDPKLAEAYSQVMSDPEFLRNNPLSRKSKDQTLFPKEKE